MIHELHSTRNNMRRKNHALNLETGDYSLVQLILITGGNKA